MTHKDTCNLRIHFKPLITHMCKIELGKCMAIEQCVRQIVRAKHVPFHVHKDTDECSSQCRTLANGRER
jgi:hypothetical protein